MKHTCKLIVFAGSLLTIPFTSALADGKAVYNKTCKMCHATGIAGAPKVGDAAAWAERSKKGIDAMAQNAIKGFKGSTGRMPPKGGNSKLSDADIKAAVQYMVDSSK